MAVLLTMYLAKRSSSTDDIRVGIAGRIPAGPIARHGRGCDLLCQSGSQGRGAKRRTEKGAARVRS